MPPREQPYHHGDLRRALVHRAADQLGCGSVDELSLRGLARDLGVSHGAPSRHFADRQAFLTAIAEHGWEQLEAELVAVDPGPPARLRDRLQAQGQAYVSFAVARPALMELMTVGKVQRAHRAGAWNPETLLSQAQHRGEIAAADTASVALSVWALLHGIAALGVAGMIPVTGLGDVVRDSVDRLFDGLTPR